MAIKDEIRDFLLSRRARITPKMAGLPEFGLPGHGLRRVAGLRREEVAQLAGVSVEYYSRLERGKCRGISDTVLVAVARALRLDDVEREHLLDLVHAANAAPARKPPRKPAAVRPGVQRLLDAMTEAPAYVWNGRLDVLAANVLGRALFLPLFPAGGEPLNQARFLFLDETSRSFFPDWELLAHDAVAVLRAEAGRDPHEPRLADLVRELTTKSPIFRGMWAEYDLRRRRSGVKRFHHPVVGPVTVTFEKMAIIADPDLRITAGLAEPGSESETALRLLASWAASTRTEGRA